MERQTPHHPSIRQSVNPSNETIRRYDWMIRSDDTIRRYDPTTRSGYAIRWYDQTIRLDDTIRWYDPMIRSDDTIRWYDTMPCCTAPASLKGGRKLDATFRYCRLQRRGRTLRVNCMLVPRRMDEWTNGLGGPHSLLHPCSLFFFFFTVTVNLLVLSYYNILSYDHTTTVSVITIVYLE